MPRHSVGLKKGCLTVQVDVIVAVTTIWYPSKLAEAAVLKGIEQMVPNEPIRIHVALEEGSQAETFTFPGERTVPRLILHLVAGQLSLRNILFLVLDA